MIEFEQNISNKNYLKAIIMHYFGYKSTMVTPVLGLILLIAFLFKQFSSIYFTIVGILWGVFLIVRPFFSIHKTYIEYKKTNPNSMPTRIKLVGEDKLFVENAGQSTEINFLELFGYRDKGKFLFLYITQKDFLLIEKDQMKNGQIQQIMRLLTDSGISIIK